MAKNREQIMQEIRNWKGYISNVKSIPLDPKHTYTDENDIYERLHTYIKGYVENIFGLHTDVKGVLINLSELSDDQQEWRKATEGMSALDSDWYNIALKGNKNGFLPELENVDEINPGKLDGLKEKQKNIRYEVEERFLPAYRALRDSFSKRWWFEWIFNHKQYVAERDAVKVMGNLIMSMSGFTKEELDGAYKNNTKIITQENLYPTKPIKETKQEIVVDEKKLNALERFKKRDEDEKVFFPQVVNELYKGMQGEGIINLDAARKSIPTHVYLPLVKFAEGICKFEVEYGSGRDSDPEAFKKAMEENVSNASMYMFEEAFKAFGLVDPITNRPVFGEMSLKDRIVSAQNATDVMLKNLTPVGFDKKNFGYLAKGSYILDNGNIVLDFLKSSLSGKYSEADINTAFSEARKQFGVLYRGERMEMPQVYKVDYRPDTNNLRLEAKAITEAQTLVNGANPVIKDEALKAIINNNVRKYKEIQNQQQAVVPHAEKERILEEWTKTEKKLAETYSNYDPKAAQDAVNAVVGANKNAPEKVNVDLKEPKPEIVPPVEQNSVEIAPHNVIK